MAAHEWASQSLRQMVIQQIEDTSRKFGNISVKTSQEYEQHILDKAQSRDDYLQMVARLILHIKEVRGKGGMGGTLLQGGNISVPSKMDAIVNPGTPTMIQQNLNIQQQNMNIQQQQNINSLAQQLPAQMGNIIRPNQLVQQNITHQLNTANRGNDISQNIVSGQPMQVTLQGGQIISQRGGGMIPQQPLTNTPFINQINNMTNSATSSVVSVTGQMPISVQQQPGNLQKPKEQQIKVMQQLHKQRQIINQQRNQQQQQQNSNPANVSLQTIQNTSQNFSINTVKVSHPTNQQKGQIMLPSPAKNIPPSPQSQQPTPSPSQPMVSPAMSINPPSVGPSPSPLTQVDEIMYFDKFKEMSKFIEPLKRLIRQMPNNDDLKKEHAKMTGLLDIITNKNRRVQMSVLNQCENVLKRLFPDAVNNAAVGTPEPVVLEQQVQTPVKQPLLPMGEVVTNIISSAQLMSETRQNILPGVFALNAPMIRPPPPLPKARKRSYADHSTTNEKKSILPHALQMEIVHLVQKFNIKLDQSQSADKAGVTLICESKDNNIPPMACSMSVRVPGNYPKTEPGYYLKDFGNSVKVSEVRNRMTNKLMRLPYTMTFSSILIAWEQSLLECYVS